jgi:hypothetical protein
LNVKQHGANPGTAYQPGSGSTTERIVSGALPSSRLLT